MVEFLDNGFDNFCFVNGELNVVEESRVGDGSWWWVVRWLLMFKVSLVVLVVVCDFRIFFCIVVMFDIFIEGFDGSLGEVIFFIFCFLVVLLSLMCFFLICWKVLIIEGSFEVG